ncbi:MAG: heterodisulfide reductase subunit A [bacterium]|nr:MAG: heterodisulfide reductase subunit A [bacterium]
MTQSMSKPVVVIGGGISGITVALEAAETGTQVTLVEKEPYLGGRVVRMHQYFPKLCSPLCGMEINFRRIKSNPDVRVITNAEVQSVSGAKGDFSLKISVKPEFINDNCTACGKCVEVCPVERKNDFNYSMDNTKAVYMAHPMAYPSRYVIDGDVCKGSECGECVKVCEYDAIDLNGKGKTLDVKAEKIVYATGWKPYDAAKITTLGFGSVKNVVSNVMMERIAAVNGPTGGRIIRPSDGKEAKNIIFVQCAGSRDENHLPYCSSVCCLATLKQTTYVREAYPDSQVTIFYIDIRSPGKYETFYAKVAADKNVTLIKGKVAKIVEDSETGDVIVTAEDVHGGKKIEQRADMVVLATGMEPTASGNGLNGPAVLDDSGFMPPTLQQDGIFSAGVAKMPFDVSTCLQDATGTAIYTLKGTS